MHYIKIGHFALESCRKSSDSRKKWTNLGKRGEQNLELCFETEEFEPVLKRLKEKNLKLIHDVIEESWGQYTIRFTDPEGNIIELGESIACFVNRLYHEGMSIAEIVQKTSVNKEQVEEYLRI